MANTMVKETGLLRRFFAELLKSEDVTVTDEGIFIDENAIREAEEISKNDKVEILEKQFGKLYTEEPVERQTGRAKFIEKMGTTRDKNGSNSGGGGNANRAGHGNIEPSIEK